MKFIRKNGRIIPIKDGAPKVSDREKSGNRIAKVGIAVAGASTVPHLFGAHNGIPALRKAGLVGLGVGLVANIAGATMRSKEIAKRTGYDPKKNGRDSKQAKATMSAERGYVAGDLGVLAGGYAAGLGGTTALIMNAKNIASGIRNIHSKIRFARAKNVTPQKIQKLLK